MTILKQAMGLDKIEPKKSICKLEPYLVCQCCDCIVDYCPKCDTIFSDDEEIYCYEPGIFHICSRCERGV